MGGNSLMFMTIGLIMLGILAFSLATIWHKRIVDINCYITPLSQKFGEPDTSGKKEYTNCQSYQWVMKNLVYRSYLDTSEGFRNFMMNRTITGTLILSMFLGLIPVMIIYILFQSYNLMGASLILIFIAVFVLRGPGSLEVSNLLLKWQAEQELEEFNIGDLAYARVSLQSIQSWIRFLLAIGTITLALAPWGEQIPIALAYIFTLFLGFAYTNLFLPISAISMPLALIIFFIIAPLTLILIGLFLRSVKKQIVKDEGMRL